VVKETIERVEGVSAVNYFGGVERELQVVIDPERLAQFRLTIPEVVARMREESLSLSAGDVEEGKRRYVVRAEGELNEISAIEDVVLRTGAATEGGGFGRVRVGDIADVQFGYKEPARASATRVSPASP
jgi:HAE1 family hydrophobic/amphiphilic exporter-1